MKKLILSIAIIISVLTENAYAQPCPYNNTVYLSGPAPTTVGASVVATQTWGGDYNTVTGMQAGYTYEISTCSTPTFDSELTIYPAGGGTAVAYDDDGCGTTGGPSKIMFTPTQSGSYDILLDQYQCLSNQIDMTMTVTLISTGGGGNPPSLYIPVVVHVVYKNATENVSNGQIMTQLDALNADYRKLNPDFALTPSVFQPFGADMSIEFCLATLDPNGNPTSGITRTSTSNPNFSQANDPKSTATGGRDNWDPTRYLNIWVCDLSGSLLGYATFPANLASDPQKDGVVIDYAYFGTTGTATAPFDKGRTATHEVGHWLNLRHVWGDANCGDDFVNDTPTQQSANTGCPAFPSTSCGNAPNGDMFMNYMDYTDDACMYMFTVGQKSRADAAIANTRNQLSTSGACGPVGVAEHNVADHLTLYPNPAKQFVIVNWNTPNKNIAINIYDVTGRIVFAEKFSSNTGLQTTINTSTFNRGVYAVEMISEQNRELKKLVID